MVNRKCLISFGKNARKFFNLYIEMMPDILHDGHVDKLLEMQSYCQ